MNTRKTLRRLLFGAAVGVYVSFAALAYFGSQGLLGMTADPFYGLPLGLIGLPWTLGAAFLPLVGAPLWLGQSFVLVAPVFNLWLLWYAMFRDRG